MTGFHDGEGNKTQPRIWIDYLCIDQSNTSERNHQVALMSQIYSLAKTVVVWLGREADDSAAALDFMDYVFMKFDHRQAEFGTKMAASLKPAMTALLSRDYWYRLWIVQEFSLARHALVFAGRSSCSVLKCDRISLQLSYFSALFGFYGLHASTLAGLPFFTGLVVVRTAVFPSHQFHDLVAFWKHQKCLDPRDRIFGLLGMTDAAKLCIRVDYSMTPSELLVEVVRAISRETGYAMSSRSIKELTVALEINPKSSVWQDLDPWDKSNFH
jgi:hypothetical protein